jgi:hypothetical protein
MVKRQTHLKVFREFANRAAELAQDDGDGINTNLYANTLLGPYSSYTGRGQWTRGSTVNIGCSGDI